VIPMSVQYHISTCACEHPALVTIDSVNGHGETYVFTNMPLVMHGFGRCDGVLYYVLKAI
jgi:hypothetical protein